MSTKHPPVVKGSYTHIARAPPDPPDQPARGLASQHRYCRCCYAVDSVFCRLWSRQACLCPALIRDSLSGRLGAMECTGQMPQGCSAVPSGEFGMLEGLQLEIWKKLERAESHSTWTGTSTDLKPMREWLEACAGQQEGSALAKDPILPVPTGPGVRLCLGFLFQNLHSHSGRGRMRGSPWGSPLGLEGAVRAPSRR